MTEPLVALSEHIAAPIERVWACLTEREAVRCWFGPHMWLDARPGGGFTEVWRDGDRTVTTTGRVLRMTPPRWLVLSWRDEDWPAETAVSITLEPVAHSTHLQLVHSGWRTLGADALALAEAHRAGWRVHLASLRRYAEEGVGTHGS